MKKETVVGLLDSTGIRREEDTVVPINGKVVPLPYLVIRTKEAISGADNGKVGVLKTEWGVALFAKNRDCALEAKVQNAIRNVGAVEIIRYPDGPVYQTTFKFTTRQILK